MTKAVLILLEDCNENTTGLKKIFHKMLGMFETLIPNKVENIELTDEKFSLYIVKIPRAGIECGKLEQRLERLCRWMQKEEIEIVAYDDYIENNSDFKVAAEKMGVEVVYGDNIFFAFEIRILKKLLKSRGYDISEVDTVIMSDGSSRYEIGYIKYLSPLVKYLTYVSSTINIEELIDDIFNSYGFSIRVCSNIEDCVGDAGLIINLARNEAILKDVKVKHGLIIRNVGEISTGIKSNATVLNDINIDISSKFKMQTQIENKYKYRICEMYILSKLGKMYLLKQVPNDDELAEIYACLKNEGVKIAGLNGENI